MSVRVVVVEDTTLAGQVLADALGREPGIEAWAMAGSLDEVVGRCRSLRPCVLVISDRIAESLDFQALGGSADAGAARVIVLGGGVTRSEVLFWLRLGCGGYLSRQEGLQALKKAVLAVASGQVWARRADLAALLAEVLETREKIPTLSPREREVLHLITGGLTNVQISISLSISLETVRWHVRRVFRKIGARSRAQAIELAQKLGFQRQRSVTQPSVAALPAAVPVQKPSCARGRRALGAAHRI